MLPTRYLHPSSSSSLPFNPTLPPPPPLAIPPPTHPPPPPPRHVRVTTKPSSPAAASPTQHKCMHRLFVACALGQKQAEEKTLNGFSSPLPFFEFFHPANTTARCTLLAFLSSAPHRPTPKKIPFELFVRWLSPVAPLASLVGPCSGGGGGGGGVEGADAWKRAMFCDVLAEGPFSQ